MYSTNSTIIRILQFSAKPTDRRKQPTLQTTNHTGPDFQTSTRHISQKLSTSSSSPVQRCFGIHEVPKCNRSLPSRLVSTAAAASQGGGNTNDDWWIANDSTIRNLPLAFGAGGGFLVVLNRVLSGVAPVADAGSSQSRADILCLAFSATLLLSGLVWKSLQTKPPQIAPMIGVETLYVNPNLSQETQQELLWVWSTFHSCMPCGALVVVYNGTTMIQAGLANVQRNSEFDSTEKVKVAAKVNPLSLMEGSICTTVKTTGRANYLANLALFPGRVELTGFLPENTQAVLVEPIGREGVMVVASDRVRGFGPKDQGWIATVAQKLEATLEEDWEEGRKEEGLLKKEESGMC